MPHPEVTCVGFFIGYRIGWGLGSAGGVLIVSRQIRAMTWQTRSGYATL
jgi:hypothetical protein